MTSKIWQNDGKSTDRTSRTSHLRFYCVFFCGGKGLWKGWAGAPETNTKRGQLRFHDFHASQSNQTKQKIHKTFEHVGQPMGASFCIQGVSLENLHPCHGVSGPTDDGNRSPLPKKVPKPMRWFMS